MAENVGRVIPGGTLAQHITIKFDSNSTWSTNTGNIYNSSYIYLLVQNGHVWCTGLDVRMSSVGTRPTITITDDRLKNWPAIAQPCSTIRMNSSGATQYPCDDGGLSHDANSNKLTLKCNSFTSSTPSGYFMFVK